MLFRSVILVMRYGWPRAWCQRHPDASAPPPAVEVTAGEFGAWRMFVPQKAISVGRAKRLVVASGVVAVGAALLATVALLRM